MLNPELQGLAPSGTRSPTVVAATACNTTPTPAADRWSGGSGGVGLFGTMVMSCTFVPVTYC